MQVKSNIKKPRGLKDFTRLVLAFCLCLLGLTLYQHTRLLQAGIIDTFFSKALTLYVLHQIGFSALVGLLLAFIFRFLEGRLPALGFRFCIFIFSILLVSEALLIEYFVRNHEVLDADILAVSMHHNISISIFFYGLLLILATLGLYFLSYKLTRQSHKVLSRMYPLTIIFFALFLGTVFTEKQAINENKTQYLLAGIVDNVLDFNKYEGDEPYPLVHTWTPKTELSSYFELKQQRPNFVFVIMDGLGADFVNQNGKFKGFTPFLDSLATKSLHWENYLTNTTNHADAVPMIFGSLPFGTSGFISAENSIDRNTLFGLLKNNGYETSFYTGLNTSLEQLDLFLEEEQVDVVIDKSSFDESFTLQDTDEAGISLGYPDEAIYSKWGQSYKVSEAAKLEVFMNVSSSKPYKFPAKEAYLNRIDTLLESNQFDKTTIRLVKNNKDAFASRWYADNALQAFFEKYRQTGAYQNTIFIITGSSNLVLPNASPLERYRVPLLMFSPLIKTAKRFKNLASHHDVAPTLLSLLHGGYDVKLPKSAAWLGTDLLGNPNKEIALLRNKNVLRDFVVDNHLLSNGKTYKIKENLELQKIDTPLSDRLEQKFKAFKALNAYTLDENKVLPDSLAIFKVSKTVFTNEQLVWINSVFNGRNFDNAYSTAKRLAHSGKTKRALLLCNYILEEVPGHIDATILKGRIYAWNKDYPQSMAILEAAVRKYPHYQDGYAALLDVYYWSGNNVKSSKIYEQMQQQRINDVELIQKVERAMNALGTIDQKEKELTILQFDE